MTRVNWILPSDLLASSISIMRPHGELGNEGLALWLGKCDAGRIATVTHVVEVRGKGFETHPLYLRLSRRAIARLTEEAFKRGLYLVGQIHSHPETFTDLSPLDKSQGIRVPDYLSVVCPHYAQRTDTTLNQCGVHVFEGNGYRRLPSSEQSRRIQISNSTVVRLICEVEDD